MKRALAAALLAGAGAAAAGPADYVLGARVEPGEPEFEAKFGIERDRQGRSAWGLALGVEWVPLPRWGTEVTVEFGREPGASARLAGIEWENRLALVQGDGRTWDLALLVEAEREFGDDDAGWSLRYGPLLEWQRGPVAGHLNLLFERRLQRAHPPTELAYQWEIRGAGERPLAWGLQGFGELGRWDHWAPRAAQSHRLGPVLFARSRDPAVEIEAALLFGMGGAAPRHTLRLQAALPF
ncbi:MAG TPA: hypothetical protein VJM48_10545 [Methylibium sp.]|nr:hypothetical protein [Methylibium sp.]